MNSGFGLIVIPDEEDVTTLSGQQQGQVELGLVEVLRLIHEEDGRSRLPAVE